MCICWLVIIIDSVYKTNKKLLEECKRKVKEKQIIRHITEEIQISSDDEDDSE